MQNDAERTPPRSGDMKRTGLPAAEDVETEGSTGALQAPEMPPIVDTKGDPDIGKRR